MIALSVVIITLNEEKNIERCIRSVQSVADEIVVVDSLSADDTVAIARRLGAKIVLQRFLGHLEQKNFATEQAKYDWVLSIDADEELSAELAEEIKKIKSNPTAQAYHFNRLNNYCGHWIKHGGWYPDRKIRLYNRKAGTWKGENPHDRWTLHDNNERPSLLKGDLLHYSYSSISDHLKKIEKYSDIAARQKVNKGEDCSILKIWLGPKWKFVKDYIIRLGFLDGYWGYIVCKLSSMENLAKYAKTRQYARWKRQGKDF